jgi:hypothetical protein
MTIETLTLILLVAGLVPYHVSRTVERYGANRRVYWQVRAVFWLLTIARPTRGRSSWCFTMPLIQKLATAIWKALRHLVS